MVGVSVGKPAPDFTATAVMDGKLKGIIDAQKVTAAKILT
jgi:hypothetical protein